MATTTPLAGIAGTFAQWGIRFDTTAIVPGRPTGRFEPVGVMIHHDAVKGPAGASHKVARVGRSDVPGPLYQFVVRRDLVVDVVTLGRANHAGEGGPWGVIEADAGNRMAVGVCFENAGTDAEPLPARMLALGELVTAAVFDHLGLPVSDVSGGVCGHREYTPRKIDPHGVDMRGFRAAVAFVARQGPRGQGEQEEDMITPENLRELLQETEFGLGPANSRILNEPDGKITLEGLLVALVGHTAAQSKQLAELTDRLDQVIELLTPPAPVVADTTGGGS